MNPKYMPAAQAMKSWKKGVHDGTPPTFYPVAAADHPLAQIEIGPGLVTLIGGAPGSGKTALVMQMVIDALARTPSLRALVANVEMSPAALLDRQLARLSGIELQIIRHRKLTLDHADRIAHGVTALEFIAPRLTFGSFPFDFNNFAETADATNADVLVFDYIQRFKPPTIAGKDTGANKKAAIDEMMNYIRAFADAGKAVIVVAAVGRQKDESGRSSYGNLNMASFRESSELEYGADDAFLLVREAADSADVMLKHVKSRHGEMRDIPLQFTGTLQRFDAGSAHKSGGLADKVQALWSQGASEDERSEW